MGNGIGPGDFHQGLASVPARKGFPHLMGGQLGLASEPHAARHCPLAAFVCASPDQFPLEFSQAAEHSQHKPPMGSRRICPRVSQGTEACVLLRYRRKHVQQVRRAAGEPVQPGHQQRVPAPRASIARCSCRLSVFAPETFSAKTLSATSSLERSVLRVQCLAVSADASVTNNGHGCLQFRSRHLHNGSPCKSGLPALCSTCQICTPLRRRAQKGAPRERRARDGLSAQSSLSALRLSMALFANDDVVVDGYAKGSARFDQCRGHVHIRAGKRRITGWMIVHQPTRRPIALILLHFRKERS